MAMFKTHSLKGGFNSNRSSIIPTPAQKFSRHHLSLTILIALAMITCACSSYAEGWDWHHHSRHWYGSGGGSSGSGSTGTSSTGSGTTSTGSTGTSSSSGSTGSGSTGTSSTGSGTTSTGSGSTGTSSTGSGTTSTGTSSTGSSGSTGVTDPDQTCTLYVSPTGSNNNSGTSASSAITLLGAASVAVAGDVVCIEPGTYDLSSTFMPAHSGNANAWITYENVGTGTVNILWTAGSNASDQTMFHMYNATFPDGPSYLIFKGLTLNGQNVAENGFFCEGSSHLKYLDDTVENMGSSGIGSVKCDYQTADHDLVYHNGYEGGWSSGISYNSNQFFDTYAGVHNFVTNNIVAGNYDGSSHHTDGNGIIMDLSNGTYTEGTTPNVLIANNVVYGNGGRCIEINYSSNAWVLNNTCYDNGLDLTLGKVGDIVNSYSNNDVFVNNIVQSWNNEISLDNFGSPNPTGLTYKDNLIYEGTTAKVTTGYTTGNPDFVSPPAYNATAGGQYANTISPTALGNDLTLQTSSPATNAGIDPTSLAGSNTSLVNDISQYIYTDIDGTARPKGGPFTLGAYQ
jgi:hypothetical protein